MTLLHTLDYDNCTIIWLNILIGNSWSFQLCIFCLFKCCFHLWCLKKVRLVHTWTCNKLVVCGWNTREWKSFYSFRKDFVQTLFWSYLLCWISTRLVTEVVLHLLNVSASVLPGKLKLLHCLRQRCETEYLDSFLLICSWSMHFIHMWFCFFLIIELCFSLFY